MELQLLSFPVIFTAIIFLLVVKKLCKRSTQQTPNIPPGPKKLPDIGNMHQMASGLPHRRLRDLAKKYGSIMHIQLGEVSNVVISSPEAAKEIMKTHDLIFSQRPFFFSANIIMYNFSDIAFAPYGESWRAMRKLCVLELLSAKRVQSFRPIGEEKVSKFINEILACAGSPFNFSRKLFALTYSITARASFGKKCKDQDEFIPIAEEITQLGSGFFLSDLFPSLKWLNVPSGMRTKLKRLSRDADRIIENIILDHTSVLGNGPHKHPRNSFLDVEDTAL